MQYSFIWGYVSSLEWTKPKRPLSGAQNLEKRGVAGDEGMNGQLMPYLSAGMKTQMRSLQGIYQEEFQRSGIHSAIVFVCMCAGTLY